MQRLALYGKVAHLGVCACRACSCRCAAPAHVEQYVQRPTASLPLHAPGWLALQVREEGVQALFKGLAPNYVKVVPSIAIAFVTYEQVRLRLLKWPSSCVL